MYRVTKVVADLGWVDLHLESSPGRWAATVATYCPSQMVQHPKYKSTQLRSVTTFVTLYLWHSSRPRGEDEAAALVDGNPLQPVLQHFFGLLGPESHELPPTQHALLLGHPNVLHDRLQVR